MGRLHPQLAHSHAPELNESPTTTPFQTRAASPVHTLPAVHSLSEVQTAMENIVLFHRRREVDRVAVSVVDGSVNVPTSAKMKYLAIYFLFNLFLTLFNKALMTSVSTQVFSSRIEFLSRPVLALYVRYRSQKFCSTASFDPWLMIHSKSLSMTEVFTHTRITSSLQEKIATSILQR